MKTATAIQVSVSRSLVIPPSSRFNATPPARKPTSPISALWKTTNNSAPPNASAKAIIRPVVSGSLGKNKSARYSPATNPMVAASSQYSLRPANSSALPNTSSISESTSLLSS